VNLQAEVHSYKWELEEFVKNVYDLPRHWFEHSDYLGIKTLTKQAYDDTLRDLIPKTKYIGGEWRNNHRVASMRLLGKFALDMTMSFHNSKKCVDWLQIIEYRPEPEEEFTAPVVLDHLAIHAENRLIPINHVLKVRGANPIKGSDRFPRNDWVSVMVSYDPPYELKFTEKRLADVEREKQIISS
jgi:hypothetical protein